ncbi:hypothetical protein M426DRAFT_323083 [Hypoxylon sp. CI-4A]|nr:hypothetical protein M426DRAFT_323083 [Hypoxylon sp. CI-4A]
MPHYYYDDHKWDRDLSRDLAHRFSRDVRTASHPTQYIVNEGKMIVDDQTLRHSNAVIYNAPGSTLRFAPSKPTPSKKVRFNSHLAPEHSKLATAPPIYTCRGCFERRELYYRGYCHDCTSMRLVSAPKETFKLRDRQDRQIERVPDRKLVGWR